MFSSEQTNFLSTSFWIPANPKLVSIMWKPASSALEQSISDQENVLSCVAGCSETLLTMVLPSPVWQDAQRFFCLCHCLPTVWPWIDSSAAAISNL